MKMIQSILIVFLLGCLGTITNAEQCPDCARPILESAYGLKSWPVLEPRPIVVGGPRTKTPWIGTSLVQQWDIEHGGFQYRICLGEELKDRIPLEDLLGWVANVPIPYRKGLEIISEEGKDGLEFLSRERVGNGGFAWEEYIHIGIHQNIVTNSEKGLHSADELMRVILHEIGHVCNARYIGGSRDDPNTEWKAAIVADPTQVSNYGNTNSKEDMAEFGYLYAMAKYMHGDNPEYLKRLQQMTPNRFVLWEKILLSCKKCPPNMSGPNCKFDNNPSKKGPRSGTSRRERKQKRKQRREEMQKRKRKGKVGQENNYGSGRNGKRIRGRNRNNFDEMENEFQLPTSYDNQDDDFNLLDMMSTGYKRWPEKWWIPPGSSGSSNTEESTKKEEIERYKNELKEVKAEEEKAKKQIHTI